MAINLDNQIKNTEEVIIAGQKYPVVFNDQFEKRVTFISLKADKFIQAANAITDEEAEKMSLNDQKAYVSKSFADASQIIMDFFDETFGKGVGERIYKYYHESTLALSQIVGLLLEQARSQHGKNQSQKAKKYLSKKR